VDNRGCSIFESEQRAEGGDGDEDDFAGQEMIGKLASHHWFQNQKFNVTNPPIPQQRGPRNCQ
jgi:hypothetical protein